MKETDELIEDGGDDSRETEFPKRRLSPVKVALLGVAALGCAVGVLIVLWPSKAGRPVPAPADVSFGGKSDPIPSGGQVLTLQENQLANAGITTEVVNEVTLDTEGAVVGTGVLEVDAYRQAKMFSFTAGTVIEVLKKEGDSVRKGELLATVHSESMAEAQTALLVSSTALTNSQANLVRARQLVGINAPGRAEVESAERELAEAEASLEEWRAREGRNRSLLDLGAISRERYEQDRTRFKAAEAEAERSRRRSERARKLLDVSPEVKAEAEKATEENVRAASAVAAAKERLRLLGMLDSEMDQLVRSGTPSAKMSLRAGAAGTLISRKVNPGQNIQSGDETFTMADLDVLWFVAQVFDGEAGSLGVGRQVQVFVGDRRVETRGTVVLLEPLVDSKTRAVRIRVEIDNRDREFRPGTFATAEFAGTGDTTRGIAVREAAVQQIGNQSYVFIQTADPQTFELRAVRLGKNASGLIPVLEGLRAGEKVVVSGSFLLRAEWLKRNPS